MVKKVADPGVRLLFAYEAVRHVLILPFNRYAWHAVPPQSIREYSDDRHAFIGKFYCQLVVRLIESAPTDLNNDDKEKVPFHLNTPLDLDAVKSYKDLGLRAQLVAFLPLIGPAFVDKHLKIRLNQSEPVKREDGTPVYELDFDLEKLSWDDIFAALPDVYSKGNMLLAEFKRPPIGEPASARAAYENRGREMARLLGLDGVGSPDDKADGTTSGEAEQEPASKRKDVAPLEHASKRIKSDDSVSAEDDVDDEADMK